MGRFLTPSKIDNSGQEMYALKKINLGEGEGVQANSPHPLVNLFQKQKYKIYTILSCFPKFVFGSQLIVDHQKWVCLAF